KMEFETQMQQALENDEFKLFYLPYYNVKEDCISGVEALLRWQSQQYGMVNPAQIIPIAEETGLIIPLSNWVITTACQQIKIIQQQNHSNLILSVNISARQFMHAELIESLLKALQTTQFN